MRIAVRDVVGEDCLTEEDGRRLFDLIHQELDAGGEVSLDFERVTVFASLFFNFAIGRLLKDYKPDDLNARLHVENLSPDGRSILRRVIENAKDYYSDSSVRLAIAQALAGQPAKP